MTHADLNSTTPRDLIDALRDAPAPPGSWGPVRDDAAALDHWLAEYERWFHYQRAYALRAAGVPPTELELESERVNLATLEVTTADEPRWAPG